MPVLKPTGLIGQIVFLGRVPDRDSSLCSVSEEVVDMDYAGIVGEAHSGQTRPSCSRVTSQYPNGTEIRNTRQISILSAEELDATARDMGLDGLQPEWVGANIVIDGIPDFTLVPPSSRLIFESGAALTVDMENAPCKLPAKVIESMRPGAGRLYKQSARHRRGVTAWVERPGQIRLGDNVALHIPPQRIYPHITVD